VCIAALKGGLPKVFNHKFGIEIEFTGITRTKAAEVAATYFGSSTRTSSDYYQSRYVTDQSGREWRFMSDASIRCQRKEGRRTTSANNEYSVELVSPILTYYEDIKTVQELVRRLRKAGGFTNDSCGIHVHLNGADHTPKSIRNFINIVASKNDLFYKSLQIIPERMRFCKKMDAYLVERMNNRKPKTFQQIETIWYEGYREGRSNRYHNSRYHFLNLHSFFTANKTVELRGFNSQLHAGKVRAYAALALALNNHALTLKSASSRKVQSENEKFAMRVFLNRIGFIGDEFKSCREHLYLHLDGNAAWRYFRDLRLDARHASNSTTNQEGDDSDV
jgi:hypothetical protein